MDNTVKNVDFSFFYIISISLVLLTLITAVMIYFVIRYRKGRNPVSSDIRGNWKLELMWTVIPILIALSMFAVGWRSFLGLREVPPGALQVDVHAMQFSYVFNYPTGKESEGLLMVPRGWPVKLNIISEDVVHGFYLPAFRIKMDALPKMKTYTWFYAEKEGEYLIMCTQYCGVGHADMKATLRIVPENKYREWLAKR
jgi:cytochrome c oxidase subunit II